jgi:hypothetical protein
MDALNSNATDQAKAALPSTGRDAREAPPPSSKRTSVDTWLYPPELDLDLQGVDLPPDTIKQTLSVAWEYTRCVIPTYTNWSRYLAFCRVIVVGVIAEFCGSLVDIAATDHILGYDLGALFEELFAGTATDCQGNTPMAREFRTFLLATAEKTTSHRRYQGEEEDSELFRRYVEALAESPRTWFRVRDADALLRFRLAAALTCNDVVDVWFSEEQLEVLAEVGLTLYDAVAFYKHRAEGETNDTFAYVDPGLREEAFRRAREVLWALDAAWAGDRARLPVLNFLRPFGGPIHIMMRRYRFVEEGLRIGMPETEEVVAQTRRNFKLWNRVDVKGPEVVGHNDASYRDAVAQEGRLLFDGLAELLRLQDVDRERCGQCRYKASYGAETIGQFGGVELCRRCRQGWGEYIQSLPRRAAEVFPELRSTQLPTS